MFLPKRSAVLTRVEEMPATFVWMSTKVCTDAMVYDYPQIINFHNSRVKSVAPPSRRIVGPGNPTHRQS